METPETTQPQEARRRFSPVWIVAGVVALLVVALLAYALSGKPPKVGDPAPPFKLAGAGDATLDLQSQRGKVVVVNFFASWCAPCREEAPGVVQTWQKYLGQNVQFYGISYKDAASASQAFLDEFGAGYPFAAETDSRTARAYGITGVPETFVIDQSGLIAAHWPGTVTPAELSAVIDKLLKP